MPKLLLGNSSSEYSVSKRSCLTFQAIHKQRAVSTRIAWLFEDGDVLVMARPLTDAFKAYLGDRAGLDANQIDTLTPIRGTDDSLLDAEQLADPELRERLRERLGHRLDWSVVPYIYDRSVARLTHGLGVDDESKTNFFAQGGSEIFNSKFYFRIWATGLGVPLAPGCSVTSQAEALAAVLSLLTHTGSVIVKQDIAASGRGNLLITSDPTLVGVGAANTIVVPASVSEAQLAEALEHALANEGEKIVEAYFPDSRVLYSEVAINDPPAAPVVLNWGDMRMEPVWNGFRVPPVELGEHVQKAMLDWSVEMARYLQRTGYRGLVNCDSFITQHGQLVFSEVNARLGGCTHMHVAAERVLGTNYFQRFTLLTRNDLHVASFDGLVGSIDRDELLRPSDECGVILLVDDVPFTGTVQYMAYGRSVGEARAVESRLGEVAVKR